MSSNECGRMPRILSATLNGLGLDIVQKDNDYNCIQRMHFCFFPHRTELPKQSYSLAATFKCEFNSSLLGLQPQKSAKQL